MVGIAQRNHGNSRFEGASDAKIGCRPRHNLTIAPLAVVDDEGIVFPHHPTLAIGFQRTRGQAFQVCRDHADSVAIVAAKIRFDEMVGHNRRLFYRAAGGAEDSNRRRPEPFMRKQHAHGSGCSI